MNFRIPLPVKIGVSVALLVLVLTRVDFPALLQSLSRSNPYLILLATLLAFGSWALNTFKWQVLLAGPGTHLSYWQLLRLNFVSMFYNLVLPGQVGGEVIKGITLSRMGVTPMASAVSVIADRVTGFLAVFLLGLAGIVFAPGSLGSQAQLLPWLVGIGVVLTVATVVLVTGRGPALLLTIARSTRLPAHRAPKWLLRLSRLVQLPTRSWTSLAIPLFFSLAFQLVTVLINLLLCRALGVNVGYVELLWIVAVVSLLQFLPISIAGLGVREGAYVYLLHQQGAGTPEALAVSLTVFAIQVAMALTGGLLQLSGSFKNADPASNPSR